MSKVLVSLLCGILLNLLMAGFPQNATPLVAATNSNLSFTAFETPKLRLRSAQFDPLTVRPQSGANFPLTSLTARPSLALVQFKGPILPEWRSTLIASGARLYQYLPDYAYLVNLTATQAQLIEKLPQVRWVGSLQPAYKISPDLLAQTGRQSLVVQLPADASLPLLMANLTGAGAKIEALPASVTPGPSQARFITGLRSVKINADTSVLPKIAALDQVAWLTPLSQVRPTNETAAWIVQSGQSLQYPLWAQGITGAGSNPSSSGSIGTEQIVALSDTGVYLHHLDFGGGTYPNATILGITNWGAQAGSTDLTGADSSGHGTHVAGTIAGSGAASGGETPYNNGSHKGMAYGARLYVQQTGPGLDYLNLATVADPITQLMTEASQKGAHIQSNSWGGSPGSYSDLAIQADQFLWNNPAFLGVWSAGNDGAGGGGVGTVEEPGVAKNVVTVGSSFNNSASLDTLSSFSSRGPTSDGRIKPDVIAPGQCLMSVQTGTTNGYLCMSGTSMATPVVAGSAALLRDWYVNQLGYSTPQSALIKATLINSAEYMNSVGGNLPDPNQGWGRVLLQNVTNPAAAGGYFAYADNLQGLNTGEDAYFVYQVTTSNVPLKISLAWTDPAGSAGANTELVNDLDLSLTSPDGQTTYLGNHFQGQYSVTGGSRDNRNNVEGVTVQQPAVGNWKVRVRAFNVPDGPQPFSLAVRGALSCAQSKGVVTDTTDNTVTNCNLNLRQALNTVTTGGKVDLSKLPAGATIYPLSALPALKSGVSLEASCLSGVGLSQPSVKLDGRYLKAANLQAAGLSFGSTTLLGSITGLAIGNFPGPGVDLAGSGQSLSCNWLGTLDGLTAAPNQDGLLIEGTASNLTLGKAGQAASGNLISGNLQTGITVKGGASGVLLYYNLAGFKSNGATGLRNGGNALKVGLGASIQISPSNKFSSK